jgi:hypothetical protein
MICKICGFEAHNIFSTTILNKYENIKYFHCSNCEFLQTEDPFWLNEAYTDAILQQDTGLLTRNNSLAKTSAILIYFLFNKNGKFVDLGGGYGIFTRLMRDIGFDFYWSDPYSKNIIARGFEYSSDNADNVELVTCFDCFEHFNDPIYEIEKIFKISTNVIFTTNLLPNPVPEPNSWWYYAVEGGQHISFYREKTLEFIAKKYNLHFHSFWGVHLFSKKKINKYFFEKLVQYGPRFLCNHVRKNMRSKTVSDMNFIVQKSKNYAKSSF